MPLVRFEIRNEFASGAPELYREADKDDPKAILDGVAVAGLVGILRQLGDLAEFAAEVFHDLQEHVMATAAKSNKLMVRVEHIEAALPSIEKDFLSQTSHIHFAYTAGSDWHTNVKTKQNHLAHSNLPRFIMDSYEECRDPPRFHILDKFDTGGPGACLKRYSDPSFFKRVLANSGSETQKTHQEKKAHKNKKKGGRRRNVEIALAARTAEHNGRRQFASPSSCRQNSLVDTVSTFDIRSRSELGETSFDSRRSDYIECIVGTTSSIPCKGRKHNGMPSSRLKNLNYDTLGSVLRHEQNGGVDDILPERSLQEENMVDSSYVTWEEKTEITKPTSQQSKKSEDQGNGSELMPSDCDQNELESVVNSIENVDSNDVIHDTETLVEPIFHDNLSDEVGSETDHYMDALNSVVSEVETDVEHQAEKEVEVPSTKFEDKGAERQTGTANKTTAQSSSSSDPTHSMSESQSSSVSSENSIHGDPSERAAENFGKPPINVWTNGGLLGLEPSKPPDFSVLNIASQDLEPDKRNDKHDLSGNIVDPNSHSNGPQRMSTEIKQTVEAGETRTLCTSSNDLPTGQLVRSMGNIIGTHDHSECSMFAHNNRDTCMSRNNSGEFSPNASENSHDSQSSNSFGTQGCCLRDTNFVVLGADSAIDPYTDQSASRPNQEKRETSSYTLLPSHNLFENSFGRKVSQAHGNTSELPGAAKPDSIQPQPSEYIEQQWHSRTVSIELNTKEYLEHGSPTNSLTSSPPLEHMRISFNPSDGYDPSKLKLTFCDGHNFHDSIKDVFPSFQLLPEPGLPLKDINSGSDDDTFSGSSQYMSDELLSQLSETNSEHWTYNRTPGSEDNEIYNVLRRVSSYNSISSSCEEGMTDNNIYGDRDFKSPNTKSDSISLHDGSLINLPNEEDLNFVLQCDEEPMPPPPPLPPLQWCVKKPQLDLVEDKQGALHVALDLQSDQVMASNVYQRSEPPPPNGLQLKDISPSSQDKKQENQNMNGIVRQVEPTKDMDDKEDFLHQIRTKSMSLRRTTPSKPTPEPHPSTNLKLTAILEKANAIRQAFVGSDDDEDIDNWSDG